MPIEPPSRTDGSPRVRLARMALDAAMAAPGVLRADVGPRGWYITEDEIGT
jgi:hypothetical protein